MARPAGSPSLLPVRAPGASRRDLLRFVALAGAAGAAWRLGVRERGRPPVTRAAVLMGTTVHLTLVGDEREAAEAAAEATLRRMAAVERRLSRHRADSELSRLHQDGRLASASTGPFSVSGCWPGFLVVKNKILHDPGIGVDQHSVL